MDSSLNGMMLLVEFHREQSLGPILFMYINDLPYVCKHFANIYLLLTMQNCINTYYMTMTTIKYLQCGLNALQKWLDKWPLKLSASN